MIKINGKRIFLFIIVVFVIFNLSWFIITTIKYNKFVKVVPKNEDGLYLMFKEDGYSYGVKKPDYLQYTGNLSVSNMEKGDVLIIWPLLSGGYEYGFILREEDRGYEIYVDENMEPLDKDDVNTIKVFEEHKEKVEELFYKANEVWNLEE